MLNENGESFLKHKDIADTFNEYFVSIVGALGLCKWESEISDFKLGEFKYESLKK